MTITIDCRMLGASGVGVYLWECLSCFLNSPHRFVLIGDPVKLERLTAERENTRILDCGVKPFSFRELCAFPPALLKTINKTALYYSPYFNIPGGITVPIYTTIHDIIFADMPELTSPLGRAVRMWFYRRAARRSQKIFTVSEFSKSRLEHFLGNKTPVVVAYNGFQRELLTGGAKTAQKTRAILFIGNIKKHKGLSCLLDAFAEARKAGLDYKLLIVGSKDHFRSFDRDFSQRLENLDTSTVEFTGFIPHERLKELLCQAALLVQPSLYEGFGYPPLEAMVCGTPALISDIPVFKEIYADFPVTFFRAGDSGDLKDKLLALLYWKEPERLVLSEDLRAKYTFEKTVGIILKELAGES
ncbi:MAG: glycosyltransferase family 4 protein [Treponema sp.]|jgi:glycosyltransferase involved in cell wall biosynthesis|nr:glycosyltransferase family 4 protein [Treponema sp.]